MVKVCISEYTLVNLWCTFGQVWSKLSKVKVRTGQSNYKVGLKVKVSQGQRYGDTYLMQSGFVEGISE